MQLASATHALKFIMAYGYAVVAREGHGGTDACVEGRHGVLLLAKGGRMPPSQTPSMDSFLSFPEALGRRRYRWGKMVIAKTRLIIY